MIEFRHVSKSYDGALAVSDLSLVAASHEITVLVGSSGCGKTTLLRMVNRLVTPTTGQVLIDDVDVADRNPVELRRSIGYVMQNSGLLPHRTTVDNIATVPVLQGTPAREARQRAVDLMEIVGLDPSMARRYPWQLSGGQQQRVAIARALVNDPAILLADEPTGNLDSKVGKEILELLHSLNRDKGTTLIIVTHDPTIAAQTQRIIHLRDGLIEEKQ